MQLNPAAIDDSACDARLAPYTTIGLPTPQLYALDSTTVQTQVIESTILRAIYSKRQLFERMVEFWTDHFNTDINTVGDPQDRRRPRRAARQRARRLPGRC